MARWRLTDKHYLNVPGTEWEYKETGLSGKQKRVVRSVPEYLDPNDPSDYTHPELFAIIVSNGEGADPRDKVFTGPPTPDMEPLDDEARELSAKESRNWAHPIETLRSNGEGFFADLAEQLNAVKATSSQPAGPSAEDFAALQRQVAELVAQNTALKSAASDIRRP